MASANVDLMRGTLDLLILKTLSWGAMHGLEVLRQLERVTDGRLQVEEGALYPALHRMEQKAWLEATWGLTERNRKARFYRLSPVGRRQLANEVSRWSRYSEVVGLVLRAEVAR
jgi:PadR family transcriptional regulator, regulatory protein PadR